MSVLLLLLLLLLLFIIVCYLVATSVATTIGLAALFNITPIGSRSKYACATATYTVVFVLSPVFYASIYTTLAKFKEFFIYLLYCSYLHFYCIACSLMLLWFYAAFYKRNTTNCQHTVTIYTRMS